MKFQRDIELDLISGTLFVKSSKRQLVKNQLEFWTVREIIDGKHKSSVQYPDSITDLGYEACRNFGKQTNPCKQNDGDCRGIK